MNVGDIVYNQYHGIDRFGVVAQTRLDEHGWKYCIVDWVDDDKYKYAMQWRASLVGVDHSLEEYRCSQLKLVDSDEWTRILKKAKKESKRIKNI